MKASYFELDNANCTVLPVQKPMPPVWIGANANVGIRRAARMADTWFINPHNKIDTIAEQMEVYKRALDDCGKPFPDELPMAREVFVAPTRAEAIRLARPSLEAKYKAYKDWGQDKVMPSGDAFSTDFEELMNDRFLFGSPAEVTEQILVLQRRFGDQYVDPGHPLGRHAGQPGDGTDATDLRRNFPRRALRLTEEFQGTR